MKKFLIVLGALTVAAVAAVAVVTATKSVDMAFEDFGDHSF